VLRFDGGSRGNPGVSGAGAVLFSSPAATSGSGGGGGPLPCADEVCTREVWVGDEHTNNYAEYVGLIEGLRMAVDMGVSDVVVQGDSKLVIKQMTGEFAVRSASLRPLWEEARRLLSRIPRHRFEHIPRSANARADELANRAMDNRQANRS
jgi:ribonuclease HI